MKDVMEIVTEGGVETFLQQPFRVTTTLYELMATLQVALPEDQDALVVSLVSHWIATGRLRFLDRTTH